MGNRMEIHLYHQGDAAATFSQLPDLIYESLRSYRKDRCAVFGDLNLVKSLVRSGLDAEYLDPETNYHWSGIQRRIQRGWKRTIASDYGEWFLWYMKWQRFRAFHTIVLLDPLQYLLSCDFRGYIDGMLARLMGKPLNKVVILENEQFGEPIRSWIDQHKINNGTLADHFGEQELWQVMLAMVYGTRLTRTELQRGFERTIWAAVRGNSQLVPQTTTKLRAFIERNSSNGCFHVTETGAKFVQGLEKIVITRGPENEPKIEQLFAPARRKKSVSLPDRWLEDQINLILKEREWVTVPILERLLSERHEELRKNEDFDLREVLEEFEYDTLDEAQRRLNPGRPTIRRILEKLAQKGQLEKRLWSREIGRAAIVYCLPDHLPFNADSHCGQCAFYNSLRHRCRLWWLLDKSFHSSNPRWGERGEHPLSLFEIHKMKNSWRIGPHSSACLRFLDKKRDYKRKSIPESCDICGQMLPTGKISETFCRCMNCGSRYFKMRQDIKVLTGYEHEFRSSYKEIAGREPRADVERLEEEQSESIYRTIERAEYQKRRTEPGTPEKPHSRTLVIFPNDRMLVRDGKLFVLKRRKVEALPLAGTVIVDHLSIDPEQRETLEKAGVAIKDVPKGDSIRVKDTTPRYDLGPTIGRLVRDNPEFVRGFALAMGKSAIMATRRLAALAKRKGSDIELLQREQVGLLRRLERARQTSFLVYEALIMKRYWKCYDLALRTVSSRFGPRKKSRFVRDYVTNPAARARGYSAVDAAINYLHQRRLFKSRMINMKLGLGWNSGEGFLHRKSRNAEGLGLLLDLTDPFKFADREKLLEAILSYELNWRDFYITTDRQGIKFYYPQPQAIDILELIGTDADNIPVYYDGKTVRLLQAYEYVTSKLIQSLYSNAPQMHIPFIFGNQTDFDNPLTIH